MIPIREKNLSDKIYDCYRIDPTWPKDLEADVYWRLRILKYCIYNDCDLLEKVNIDAIIKAYIEGSLKVDDETATIWYGGKLLVGPIRANLDEA